VTHRVPFTPDLEADFSHIDVKSKEHQEQYPLIEFLSRCSSPDQVAAFVGSIFYDRSYMQQYLVIWGGGGDGKGALTRAIQKILASSFCVDSFDNMGRFWTSAFVGKRVVLFPDNNNMKAMQSGIWKQLTGGDPVRVEYKNENSFTAQLNAKYILTSNFAPVLKMDRADQRRAVVSYIQPICGEIDAEVEKRMHQPDQLQFLVEYCCWMYRKLSPDNGPIPIHKDQEEFIQNADEMTEQTLLSKFSFSPNMVMKLHDIKSIFPDRDVSPQKLSTILTDKFNCERFQARKEPRHVYYVGIGFKGYGFGFTPDEAEKANRATLNEVSDTQIYKKTLEKVLTKTKKS
jgi:hypothetical protein